MVRTVAMSAASALCLIWTAGCASTSNPAPKPAATTVANPEGLQTGSGSSAASVANNLPDTLDGEIRRAQTLRSKGDYDEAVRSLAQLMLVAPDNARVVGEYGKTLAQQGHSQEALAFLKRAIELQPNDWKLYSALGIAYDQLDDHASARKAYQHALALEPGAPSVLNNYAVSRMLAGDYPDAQRMLAQAELGGVSNPKIALNVEKLASLEPQPEVAAPSAAAAAKTASQAAPIIQSDLKPAVVAKTTKAPSPEKSGSSIHFATAAPKALGPNVVMERVPVDPLAGPVARSRHTPQRLAKAATAKHPPEPAKPAAPTPSLRTAADSD